VDEVDDRKPRMGNKEIFKPTKKAWGLKRKIKMKDKTTIKICETKFADLTSKKKRKSKCKNKMRQQELMQMNGWEESRSQKKKREKRKLECSEKFKVPKIRKPMLVRATQAKLPVSEKSSENIEVDMITQDHRKKVEDGSRRSKRKRTTKIPRGYLESDSGENLKTQNSRRRRKDRRTEERLLRDKAQKFLDCIVKCIQEDKSPRDIDTKTKLKWLSAQTLLDCLDKNGHAPLHIACIQGNKDWVKTLLDRGADPTVRTEVAKTSVGGIVCEELGGDTPLHLAVLSGSLECAEELVSFGADITVVNDALQSPLDAIRMRFIQDPGLFFSDMKRNTNTGVRGINGSSSNEPKANFSNGESSSSKTQKRSFNSDRPDREAKKVESTIRTGLQDKDEVLMKMRKLLTPLLPKSIPLPKTHAGWTDRCKPHWLPPGWKYVDRKRLNGKIERHFLSPESFVVKTRKGVEKYVREDQDDMIEEDEEPEVYLMSSIQEKILKEWKNCEDITGSLKRKMHIIVYDDILLATGIITKTRKTVDGEEFRISWDKAIKSSLTERWLRKGIWWVKSQFKVRKVSENVKKILKEMT